MIETFFVLTTGFLREYHSVLMKAHHTPYPGRAILTESDILDKEIAVTDTDELKDMIALVPTVPP